MVFSVPMRNWNKDGQKSGKLLLLKVFSVPMRNWNKKPRGLSRRPNSCFQRTYEELKQPKRFSIDTLNLSFSAYLWGIETRINNRRNSGQFNVFSVPMRNWNRRSRRSRKTRYRSFQRTYEELKQHRITQCHDPDKRFQRTYEELKLQHPDVGLPALIGFQRTYEELKPHVAVGTNGTAPSFQRTYEELKQIPLLFPGLGVGVFSVPMRNWNDNA